MVADVLHGFVYWQSQLLHEVAQVIYRCLELQAIELNLLQQLVATNADSCPIVQGGIPRNTPSRRGLWEGHAEEEGGVPGKLPTKRVHHFRGRGSTMAFEIK